LFIVRGQLYFHIFSIFPVFIITNCYHVQNINYKEITINAIKRQMISMKYGKHNNIN
jgi:hypothetical protein